MPENLFLFIVVWVIFLSVIFVPMYVWIEGIVIDKMKIKNKLHQVLITIGLMIASTPFIIPIFTLLGLFLLGLGDAISSEWCEANSIFTPCNALINRCLQTTSLPCKQRVSGSNPSSPSKKSKSNDLFFLCYIPVSNITFTSISFYFYRKWLFLWLASQFV